MTWTRATRVSSFVYSLSPPRPHDFNVEARKWDKEITCHEDRHRRNGQDGRGDRAAPRRARAPGDSLEPYRGQGARPRPAGGRGSFPAARNLRHHHFHPYRCERDRDGLFEAAFRRREGRSEEHTSELQSPCNLVCRLLLEKKKKKTNHILSRISQRYGPDR